MESPASRWQFLDPVAAARLSRVPFLALRPMLGSVSGMHRSAARGSSVEFAEYRKYAAGDDPRFLDWRVYGKTDRFFVREFEADTNLRCRVVLDTSASMDFGSVGTTRFDRARTLAALLSHALLRQGDAVGLCLVGNGSSSTLPARRNRGHLRAILDTLARTRPAPGTTLVEDLHALAERIPPRGLLVILSDFFQEIPALLESLRHVRFGHHDVVLVQLLDPLELEFDFTVPMKLVDLESAVPFETDPALSREAYLEALQAHSRELAEGCGACGISYHVHRLDAAYDTLLDEICHARLRRSKARSR
jgi:uncharacterized protein (DUF58 family)